MSEFEVRGNNAGVIEVKCSSWLGFMSFIDEKQPAAHGLVYRGQMDSEWPIESTLLRATKADLKHNHTDWVEQAVERVASDWASMRGGMIMQSYAAHLGVQQQQSLTDQQAWMIGRHQGLLTPFVDWSRSPYVAAFFATVEVVERLLEREDRECVVYGISSWLFPFQLSKNSADNGNLARHALKVDAAIYGNRRAIAQQAIATYLFPEIDIQAFVEETNSNRAHDRESLYRITIPYKAAQQALIHLNRMNVNYLSLFPDDFGLAKHANLNLYSPSYAGTGNWMTPPGFETLIPKEESEEHGR
ncbi:MAG TPA: FRG domain-containing protein [Fimbriimonadaceae bacterium]|nr:FRG domain-containing protein [Fimbriimonadaceae bacterium]